MATVEEVNAAIGTNATGPATVSVNGQTVTAKTADDLIKAANHLASQDAAAKDHFGLRFTKLVPPGCG